MSIDQLLTEFGVPESASDDGVLQTTIRLNNTAQLRQLLDIGLLPERRAEHADALLDGIAAPDEYPHVALLHRLMRNAVGNDELSEVDRADLAAAFPLTANIHTQSATAAPMTVNYVWDVSTSDGTAKVIDLPNGIVLQDGGCIVARSTPLLFSCSSLVRTGAPPAGYSGDFNILGTKGAPVPTPPTPGAVGQAQSGAPGECSSNGIAGNGGGNGTTGQQGTTGTTGGTGNPGIASSSATITIQTALDLSGGAATHLLVATQSGPGGDGRDGGQGSPGQQGGNGGNGQTCGCTGNGGGWAAPGGKGGTGGRAGDGGNGVDAAGNITVYVPVSVSTTVVQAIPLPAIPGQPGAPGGPGQGGAAGTPGAAGKLSSPGGTADTGSPGDPGGPGSPGTIAGKPATVYPFNF
jgi:hypothetical protein